MKAIRLLYGLFFLLLLIPANAQSLEETFLKGNIAYGNGAYEEAETAYRSVLDQVQSAEVHYNLGNALAQQGEWSEAAFHYMHAYALNPHLEASRANLMLAANRMGLASQYPDLAPPAKWLSQRQWTMLAAVFFWAALVLFFHGDFIRYRLPLSRTLGTLSVALIIVSVTGIVQHKLFKDWGVVSSSLVTLRVAPAEQSPGESVLIEGDPIRILGEQKGFFHVMTASGNEGFILQKEVYNLPRD